MPTIFFLGASGHIGGALLYQLYEVHPELQYKVLVRTEDKAQSLKAEYPKVECIIGDIESFDQESCAGADITINTCPPITHHDDIEDVLEVLSQRKSKGYYIHTSGSSMIWDDPRGTDDGRIYDDDNREDLDDMFAIDNHMDHSHSDQVVRSYAASVNIASISPSVVHGVSPSKVAKTFPMLGGSMLLTARAFNSGFQIGEGGNRWTHVHVMDLARAYVLLVEDALKSIASGEPAKESVWGHDAHYFVHSDETSSREYISAVASCLKRRGIIKSAEITEVGVEECARINLAGGSSAGEGDDDDDDDDDNDNDDGEPEPPRLDSWAYHLAVVYGVNMRFRGTKMRKLGWKPREAGAISDIDATFGEVLRKEKEAM